MKINDIVESTNSKLAGAPPGIKIMTPQQFVASTDDMPGEEGVAEAEKKGLYYYVNKRKKAGTSRDADSPKAPTAQAWKDAAKTAKTEGVAENKLPKPYKKWAS